MSNYLIHSPAVHIPEGMSYTCHSEGVCCRVFDTIPLDAPAERALARADENALNAAAGNAPGAAITSPNPAGPPERRMARKACGECTMLTPGNLCAIHAAMGEAAKPRVCQDFPWRYVQTPGGVYVGLSFVCPSVRGNRGAPLTEQGESIARNLEVSASVREVRGTIALNPRVSISWDDYLALERALQDLLNLPGEPLSSRLIALCLLPTFADQVMAQQAAESGGAPPTVTEIVDALARNDYAIIRQLAAKQPKTSPRSRRMFLGMFTSFANTLHQRKAGRFITVAGVMSQYVRHATGLGSVSLQPVTSAISHARLDLAHLPEVGAAAQQITRYVSHCLFRKDLLLSGDVTRRVRMLALNAALIAWYAAALAEKAGAGAPTDAHWDEAIGHVERLYGFHSAFYRFFEQNRIFSDIVDSFILKPAFPYMLLR